MTIESSMRHRARRRERCSPPNSPSHADKRASLKVVDRLNPNLLADRLKTLEPNARFSVPILHLLLVVGSHLTGVLEWLVLVTVMRLVVQNHDLAFAVPDEITNDPGDHRVVRLLEGTPIV